MSWRGFLDRLFGSFEDGLDKLADRAFRLRRRATEATPGAAARLRHPVGIANAEFHTPWGDVIDVPRGACPFRPRDEDRSEGVPSYLAPVFDPSKHNREP